jgi:hypothetical protein
MLTSWKVVEPLVLNVCNNSSGIRDIADFDAVYNGYNTSLRLDNVSSDLAFGEQVIEVYDVDFTLLRHRTLIWHSGLQIRMTRGRGRGHQILEYRERDNGITPHSIAAM